ncbi:MAG: YraN family protein [Bacteroidales bacterium]|nr:YraN family protein [Bacteroidales bacterium]
MAEHNEIGVLGEELASKFLENKNYQILQRNWRWHKYEIDIIALDKDTLVFAEVKTRTYGSGENPKDAITRRKQKLILEAANAYIEESGLENEARIDVLSVILKADNVYIEHIKDAFDPEF